MIKQICIVLGFLVSAAVAQALPPVGWQEYKTGGDTLCARGGDYSFLVHKGDPQKVVIQFAGGGACWDNFTCDNDKVFTDTTEKSYRVVSNAQGVYNLKNPKNPFYGWTQIVIPYCTGDLHLGNADTTYKRMNGSTFVIHHRGGTNTRTVLNWVNQNYPQPQQLTVAGCSAGSYASVFWTPLLIQRNSTSRFVQLGDSGAGVSSHIFFPQWNMQDNIPGWIPSLDPAKVDWNNLSFVNLYSSIAGFHPQAKFSQFNHANDSIQSLYYALLGGNMSDWKPFMYKNMQDTSASVGNFHYYIAPGPLHCSLNKDSLYSTKTDGVALTDWYQKELQGQDVENVKCQQCSQQVN